MWAQAAEAFSSQLQLLSATCQHFGELTGPINLFRTYQCRHVCWKLTNYYEFVVSLFSPRHEFDSFVSTRAYSDYYTLDSDPLLSRVIFSVN